MESVGIKIAMACTGTLLLGFVCVHLAGNLLIYFGKGVLNAYALRIHDAWLFLIPVRAVLAVSVVAHIVMGVVLYRRNRRAAVGNVRKKYLVASFSSRTMLPTGIVILCFVLYHLAHYTFRLTDARFATVGHTDVYTMLVLGFSSPVVTGFYVLSMVFLGLHLQHAIASIFQTFGLETRRSARVIGLGGKTLSWAIMLGNISIPLAVYLGIVGS